MRITLCGSTRFEDEFKEWNLKLACAGHTVYSLSAFGRQEGDVGKDDKVLLTDDQKITLDLVHLDKIINSDAIVVLNPNGYVGFSTSREIRWAKIQHKSVFWLDPPTFEDISIDELISGGLAPVREPEPPIAIPPPIAPEPLVPRREGELIQLDDDIPF